MKSNKKNTARPLGFTLRELLILDSPDIDDGGSWDSPKAWESIFKAIWRRDQKYACKTDRPTLKQVRKSYTSVIVELCLKKKAKPYKYPLMVRWVKDMSDGHRYFDVSLYNPKYVEPKEGLKPWGCSKGEKPPEGHYNVNAARHNQHWAVSGVPWSNLIDTPVWIDDSTAAKPFGSIIAAILWELTFDGWTEKDCKKHTKWLKGRLEEAMKEIEEGKCTEIPPKKEGEWKVVIPDSVSQQIKEIMDKSAT